jgi:hypothetical protein
MKVFFKTFPNEIIFKYQLAFLKSENLHRLQIIFVGRIELTFIKKTEKMQKLAMRVELLSFCKGIQKCREIFL